MAHGFCPKCERLGRLLESTSSIANVEYYRCDVCGHVWTYEKHNPDAPPKDVTKWEIEKSPT
jgi:hypothetical protein